MTTNNATNRTIRVPGAPEISRLTFRGFRGEADYASMLAVIEGSKEADGLERTDTLDDVVRNYKHLTNCDPYRDMLFAEVDGEVIGYSRTWWLDDLDGNRLYPHFGFLLPEWRGQGIRQAMLAYNEQHLCAVDAGLPANGPRLFEVWASDTETHWVSLLAESGYQGVRFGFSMVRPDLENIPDLPLPEGIEFRPARPEHYRPIWEAAREAFRDEWGYSEAEWSAEQFESWQAEPTFEPSLWQIAWDGDEVVGMVLNFINRKENAEYHRQRGYTETICVRRPWRRRGGAPGIC